MNNILSNVHIVQKSIYSAGEHQESIVNILALLLGRCVAYGSLHPLPFCCELAVQFLSMTCVVTHLDKDARSKNFISVAGLRVQCHLGYPEAIDGSNIHHKVWVLHHHGIMRTY